MTNHPILLTLRTNIIVILAAKWFLQLIDRKLSLANLNIGHTRSVLRPANLTSTMHLLPLDGQSWDSNDKRMNSFVGFKLENKQVLKKIIQVQDTLKILNSDYEHHLVPSQDIHITIIALGTGSKKTKKK